MNKYCVFGNPVEHSISPLIHSMFAKQTGHKFSYERIFSELDCFEKDVKNFVNDNGKGFNITLPFKMQAFKMMQETTLRAKIAQAVNTVKIEKNILYGDNTDGIGLVKDFNNNIKLSLANKDILMIGAGGAARGIIFDLIQQNPLRILVANRTKAKAQQIALDFKKYNKVCGFSIEQIKAKPVDIIINATSVGIDNKEILNIPKIVAKNAFCYDLMYGKETAFIKWSKESNASGVSDGLGMLVEQAAEAYFIWHKIMPDTKKVLSQLKATIYQ